MNTTEKKILQAIQHLVTSARFLAYKETGFSEIAEFLDDADHVCNLIIEEPANYTRIQGVLTAILERHPECSTTSLSLE